MDREMAIQMLKRCEAESDCNHYKQQHCCIGCGQREALNLAIEALEEEEVDYCNNCPYISWDKDCISRQQAVEVLVKESQEDGAFGYVDTKSIVDLLNSLPSVNQKQITGKLESVENATSEGEESTMNQPKSKLDCISRKDAIEALEHIHIPTQAQREYAVEIFDKIPPVTPTERTGVWAVVSLDHESIGVRPKTLYCSECNWLTSFPSAWCPNCGAKMGGDTE